MNDTLNLQFGDNWNLKNDIDDDSNLLDETSQSIKTKSAIGTDGGDAFIPSDEFQNTEVPENTSYDFVAT